MERDTDQRGQRQRQRRDPARSDDTMRPPDYRRGGAGQKPLQRGRQPQQDAPSVPVGMRTYGQQRARPPGNPSRRQGTASFVPPPIDEGDTLVMPPPARHSLMPAVAEDETLVRQRAPQRGDGARARARPGATKKGRGTRPSRRRRTIILVMLACVLLLTIAGAVDGGLRVSHIYAEANDGIRHLKNIEAMVPAHGDITSLLNADTLKKVQVELTAAEHDFASLRVDLGQPGGTVALADHLPKLGDTLATSAALAAAADEACLAGLDLVNTGQTALGALKGGFFASSAQSKTPPPPPGTPPPPTLNAQTLAQVRANFEDAVKHLNAAVVYASNADLSALPSALIKPKQLSQIRGLIANWPSIRTQLAQFDGWLGVAPALLGATAPEHLLLLMMDRSELRATGGFMGNYAVATVQNGKAQPFSLEDTYFLDYPYMTQHPGQLPPAAYASWWPFRNFALRDSNLSADFPTSAQLALHELQIEGGGSAQGVVAFTPVAIARVMEVVGNIAVPEYHELVTPANLEDLIHKYQQLSGQSEATRKHFTALLAQHLLEKLHGLPPATLVKIGKQMLTSIHTKDIQIYFTDKTAEKLLAATGNDGSITHGPGDGVTIVDDNVGSNKANQFVVVQYSDTVTLDAHGTATHHLTITYTLNAHNNPLMFNLDRYLTYLRVYAPANAKLLSMDGLNFTQIGPNQINTSDFPGRQMWGGFVVVPDGQSYSLHFTWSVANAATKDSTGQWHYQLDFQHQAGSNQQLILTVTAPGASKPLASFKGPLSADNQITVHYGGNG